MKRTAAEYQNRLMISNHGHWIGPGSRTVLKPEKQGKWSCKKPRALRAARGVGSVRRIAGGPASV